MSNARFLPIAILTVISLNGFSQTDTAKSSKLPSIMGGVGVLYFNGDIGKGAGITPYSTIRGGYTFGVEERPVSFLGIQVDGLLGKLSASERSNTPSDNLNFQSSIFSGELLLNLHLDGLIFKKNAVLAPYIYAGFSYLSYKTATDSLSAAGTPYYYWTDGSIRNEPQTAADILTAKIIQRDYTYETPLNSGSTFSVPVGLGIKFRITDNVAMNLSAAYYFSFSKNIEHYDISGKNDKYLFSFFTLEYHFTKKSKTQAVNEQHYEGAQLEKEVVMKDTASSKDITKEQEAALEEKQEHADTSAVDRNAIFNENPTLSFAKGVDAEVQKKAQSGGTMHKIPDKFASVDRDHNGYISSSEITQVIDDFFEGTTTLSISDINELIDYFFDQ
jgi:hypothetical protein